MKDIRYFLTVFIFLIFYFLLLAKLFKLQVIDSSHYLAVAEKEHYSKNKILPKRGEIRMSDGFPLILNRPVFSLYAEPKIIEDPALIASEITPILNEFLSGTESAVKFNKGDIAKKISQDLFWVQIAKGLPRSAKEKIDSLGYSGIGLVDGSERFYPEGILAPHLSGFLGVDDSGNPQGYYGIEGYYNGELRGRAGEIVEEKAASGNPLALGFYSASPVENGAALTLTIRRDIQALIERKIKSAIAKYGAKSGTVLVVDPEKGSILGSASYPNYNPSKYFEVYDDAESENVETESKQLSFTDPTIGIPYEPGSVIKALTVAAAIDTKTVRPQTEYEDIGPLLISGHLVDNWDKKHHGKMNIIELLQKSNNIGAATVGKLLGTNNLRNYFVKFGLGSTTGVDLQGEAAGVLKPANLWKEIDLATAAFGQGLTATPLQLASAFSVIANGGYWVKPYVVSEISDKRGITTLESTERRRVISSQTAESMKELLTAAAEGGEAKFSVLKKYRVAGKTGTAQIPVGGRYDPTKTNATFIGFLTNQPKFVMLVKIEEPTTSIYAAETAVPLWMDIAKDLSLYFHLIPDKL